MEFGHMKKWILTAFTIAAVSTSGCSSKPDKDKEQNAISNYERLMLEEHKKTGEVLSRAAMLSAKALSVMARTNQAKVQPVLSNEQIRQARFQDQYIPLGMEVKTSLAWDGAPEPLMKSIAAAAGYEIIYLNERPPIAMTVTTSPEKRMLRDFFFIVEQQTVGYIESIKIEDKTDRRVIFVKYSAF